MGCGISMIKYLLFLANLIVALLGLAILGIGTYALVQLKEFSEEFPNPKAWGIGFVVLGSIVFVISFFGCCGAIRESHCMVVTYFVFLLVLVIIQVILGVILLVYLPQLTKAADKVVRDLYEKKESSSQETYHAIETFFQCCGKTSPADYLFQVPSSCCRKDAFSAGQCLPQDAYPKGCPAVVSEFLYKHGKTSGIALLAVAGFEAVVGILTLCLANSIRNDERRSRY